MRAYYAARAAEYDRVYAKPERQADLAALAAWLPPWFTGRRVLEIACGTGWWSRHIAPVSASLLGLDSAPETLAIARQRLGDQPGVRWIVGDAYALPAEAEGHDAAFAGFWWSHVPRRRQGAFLNHLAGRLAPGARVVMIDNQHVEGSNHPVSAPDAQGDTWQQRRLDDGSTHRVLKNFPTDAELQAAAAGVADEVQIVRWTYFWGLSLRLR